MSKASIETDFRDYGLTYPLCKAKQTNADRIRSMSDDELAEWLTNMCDFINTEDEEPYKSIYNIDTKKEETVHDSYGSIVKWLQSEVGE